MAFDIKTAKPVGFDIATAKPFEGLTGDPDVPIARGGAGGGFGRVETLGQFGTRAVQNVGEEVQGIATVIAHPIQTAKSLKDLAIGIAAPLIPGDQPQEEILVAIEDQLRENFGTIDKAKQTFLRNPVSVALAVSAAFTGLGGIFSLGSKAAKIAGLTRTAKAAATTGKVVSRVGAEISPITQATRLAGSVIKGAGKVGTPFAGSVDNSIRAAETRLGVELPASAVSKSPAVQVAESAFAKSFFGQGIFNRINKVGDDLVKIADNVVGGAAKTSDLSVAGRMIAQGKKSFQSKWMNLKNTLYSKAKFPKDLKVTPKKSLDFAKEILEGEIKASKFAGKTKGLKFWEDKVKRLAQEGNIDELKSFLQKLNRDISSKADPVVTGFQGELRKLAVIISEDIDDVLKIQHPGLARNIDRANKVYKIGIEKLNSQWGKQIKKFADAKQYDKIIPALINPNTSLDDIPRIMQVVGEQNRPIIQATTLRGLFKKSIDPVTNVFKPTSLAQEMKKFSHPKLQAILSPEQYQKLNDLAKVTGALSKTQRVIGGSQTFFLVKQFGQLGLLFTNPMQALGIMLGDIIMTKFLGSKAGQKFLTEGFDFGVRAGRAIQKAAPATGATGAVTRQLGRSGELER